MTRISKWDNIPVSKSRFTIQGDHINLQILPFATHISYLYTFSWNLQVQTYSGNTIFARLSILDGKVLDIIKIELIQQSETKETLRIAIEV